MSINNGLPEQTSRGKEKNRIRNVSIKYKGTSDDLNTFVIMLIKEYMIKQGVVEH